MYVIYRIRQLESISALKLINYYIKGAGGGSSSKFSRN